MARHTRLATVSLLLPLACRSALPVVPRLSTPFVCEIPSRFNGPVDATLPAFAEVDGVRVCAGDAGLVAVVWRRDVAWDTLEWDEKTHRFRVKGSDITLGPSAYQPTHDPISGHPYPPQAPEVFKPDELLGMAVLGSETAVQPEFFDYGSASSSSGDGVLDLAYADGQWHGVMNLYAPVPGDSDPDASGVAMVRFDASGWEEPRVVLPAQFEAPIWVFVKGGEIDLLWQDCHLPFLAFPDSGMEVERLRHARIGSGPATSAKTVYTFPQTFGMTFQIQGVVRLGAGRYDVLCERGFSGLLCELDHELVHVSNLLARWGPSTRNVGRYEAGSVCIVLALENESIQSVWLEEVYDDPGGRLCGPWPRRAMEAHFREGAWSGPSQIGEGEAWDDLSLAGTAFRFGDRQAVLVVWRGEESRLTYTLGLDSGEWSEPASADLVVGRRNWLVNRDEHMTLVTQVDRNLYWCRLRVCPAAAATHCAH